VHTPEELLAAAQGSPAAVAVHDRQAWVDLYADAGEVNDPVGSRPHRGREAIERFYDTFIAPNTIEFHFESEAVSGMSVVRDLSLVTVMSTGARLEVPMHLRYDFVEENGTLKIARLAAHWELATMIGQLLRAGIPGLVASAKLTPQLIGNQGLSGAMGFLGGFRGVGSKGKTVAEHELRALHRPADGADVSAEELRRARFRKWIAAGRTVSVSAEFDSGPGIVFVEFTQRALQVETITVFRTHPV